MRGEVYRLNMPRGTRGDEQSGTRYAVVVQSDSLPLSTWLVAPTSTSARRATFRPEVEVAGCPTLVLAEQAAAVDPTRLGECAGLLTARSFTASTLPSAWSSNSEPRWTLGTPTTCAVLPLGVGCRRGPSLGSTPSVPLLV